MQSEFTNTVAKLLSYVKYLLNGLFLFFDWVIKILIDIYISWGDDSAGEVLGVKYMDLSLDPLCPHIC